MKQQRFDLSVDSNGSQCSAASSSWEGSVVGLTQLSQLILDIAWLIEEPVFENMQHTQTFSQIQRFNFLLSFLIQNESIAILERALLHMEIIKCQGLATGNADADMTLFQRNLNRAKVIVCQKLQNKGNLVLHTRKVMPSEDCFNQSSQDVEVTKEGSMGLTSPSRSSRGGNVKTFV